MRSSYIGNDIESKIKDLMRSIDSMYIHGVASITMTPARHYPETTKDNGHRLPEFRVSDLVITDDEGKTFTITLFHSSGGVPMTVTIPPPDAVRDVEAVAAVCGTQVTA